MTIHIVSTPQHIIQYVYKYEPCEHQPMISPEDLESLTYNNEIEILASSFDEYLVIIDGCIVLGNARFPVWFHTKGLNETLSVFGQFNMSLEAFMEELSDDGI